MLNELTSIYNNPPAGYHFLVVFNYDFKSILLQPVSFGSPVPFIPLPHDSLFQDVSGLSCNSPSEIEIKEGGSEFTHKRPSLNFQYDNLVLKRGLCAKSLVTQWVKASIKAEQIASVNIFISLLNDVFFPIHSWSVEDAYPIGWEFSALDAKSNEVMTETITLKYASFNTIEAIIEGHAATLAVSLALESL